MIEDQNTKDMTKDGRKIKLSDEERTIGLTRRRIDCE